MNSTEQPGLDQVRSFIGPTIEAEVLISGLADIREATRDAVRHMIGFLSAEHGLTRTEAYMLCSVAGDLRMHEVVRTDFSGLRLCLINILIVSLLLRAGGYAQLRSACVLSC